MRRKLDVRRAEPEEAPPREDIILHNLTRAVGEERFSGGQQWFMRRAAIKQEEPSLFLGIPFEINIATASGPPR